MLRSSAGGSGMARKNRSNNSFAPIVITVLVAGVVGYYAFIKSPPQSTLAEGDGQGGFAFERAPDSSAGKPSTGTASKLVGDSILQEFSPRNLHSMPLAPNLLNQTAATPTTFARATGWPASRSNSRKCIEAFGSRGGDPHHTCTSI